MANIFKSFRGIVSAATATTIVPTAGLSDPAGTSRNPDSTAIIHALYISNVDVSEQEVLIDFDIYNGTTPYFIGKNVPIPSGSSLYLEKPINLDTSDSLRVTTAGANDVHVVASTLLITPD